MTRILYLAIAVLMAAMASCSHEKTDAPRDYYSEVKSVNKLVLARISITKMATIDDLNLSDANDLRHTTSALLDAMKFGNRKAAYSYDTQMQAYMDLSKLQPDDVKVDEANHTLTLQLPAIQTEIAGRDITIREDHYRVSGMRTHIDAAERAKIKEMMNQSLKKEVEENPVFRNKLVEQARGKASNYFSTLLGDGDYKVIVNISDK